MKLLILGGTRNHPGGVEAFCARAKAALERRGGYSIERIETGTAYLTLGRVPILIRGLLRLSARRFWNPDCVWLQYVNLPDLLYLVVARLLGMRVLVTPHLGANWRSQSNPLLRRISKTLLKAANGLALISKTQELELALPDRPARSYIRNFLSEELLARPPVERSGPKLLLLHAGRLSEGKGTFLVVDACAALKRAGVDFSASIAGGADEETYAKLRSLVADYGLADQVAVLGRVSDETLLDLLFVSDVLVHPSRIDSYPLIVLECLASGVFPVCMQLPGAEDMVKTYDGNIVSEAAASSEAAAYLASHAVSELRARAMAASLAVRADYSWAACGELLEAALKTIARPSAAANLADRARSIGEDKI